MDTLFGTEVLAGLENRVRGWLSRSSTGSWTGLQLTGDRKSDFPLSESVPVDNTSTLASRVRSFRMIVVMTTAHRPTFEPARGGSGRNEGDLSKLSQQYSSKDMPSHTKLKYRQKGQGHAEDMKSRDLRRELEEKEKNVGRERRSRESGWNMQKKPRLEGSSAPNVQDEDDPYDEDINDNSDDDEDDAAELMAELARIKKERALEKAQRDAALAEEQERIRTENILHGNPLLNSEASDFKVKRRWDDDVVFKNCAKGIEERKKEQVFINDAIRSEFHKKFMEKYIK